MADVKKQKYKVLTEGHILNNHYQEGDVVELYPAQAKNLMVPYGGQIQPLTKPSDSQASQ